MAEEIPILIVEDNPADAELEERELRRSGLAFTSRRVETRQGFLEGVRDLKPQVILADYSLPDFSGMEALALAYELCPTTPVVIVTGSINEETAADCIKAGATDYVLKGHLGRLGPSVRSALERRRILDEKARAEDEVRASERKYRALFTESRDGVFIADAASGLLLDANAAMLAMAGHQLEYLRATPLLTLVAAPYADATRRAWEGTAAGGTLGAIEIEIVRADGALLPVEIRAGSYHDAGGAGRIFGVVRDISERRQRERELRASETRHRALFEEAVDAIFVADAATGMLVDANRAARTLVGRDRDEIRAMHQTALHPPEDQADARASFERESRQVRQEGIRTHVLHRDGRRIPVEISGGLMQDETGRTLLVGIFRDLTERLAGEQAIRESEQRFRLAIESATEGILIHADGTIRYANPAAARLFGARATEALVGQRMMDLVHPDYRESVRRRQVSVMERAEAAPPLPEVLLRVDGTPFVAEASAVPFGYGGQPGMMVFYRDVSERVAAEAAVSESEKRFRSVVEGAPEAILIHTGGIIGYVNRAGMALFGATTGGELLGHPVIERVSPEFRDLVRQRVAGVTGGGGTAPAIEEVLTRVDGTPFFAEVSAVQFPQGGQTAVLVFARDVTELRRAAADRLRLSAALDQAAEVAVITDTAATIQYVNRAFERVTGYTREEAIGQNPKILKSGMQGPEVYVQLWDTLRAGKSFTGVFVNRKKNGDHYVAEVVISPVRDAAGAVVQYVGLQRDVTHERDLEEQLRQAQKMEAIGQLTGGIAHDFNNLLGIVLANASLLRAELQGGAPELLSYLDDLEEAARHGGAMVKKLLAFGRRERLQPAPLELRRALEDVRRTLTRFLPETIRVHVQDIPESLAAMADAGAVEQILLNLATNARDAMPEGGTLTLAANEVAFTSEDELLLHGLEEPGRYACVAVTDTGTGMDDATQERIFEPFFTTKPVGAGSGLGLPMVFGLMKLHGGFVRVYSEVGHGTSVRLFFPLAGGATPAVRTAAAAAGPVRGSETILVVEDQETLRRATARALGKLGYRILVAGDGREALELLARGGPRPDLILSDRVMPNLGGVELYQELRASGHPVAFLLMSGYAAEARGVTPVPPGLPVVEKPWTVEALAKAVREGLDAPLPQA